MRPVTPSPGAANGFQRQVPSSVAFTSVDNEVDATMQAFAQWLSEMKARSNNSLSQMLAEMGLIRDGITANNTDLTEYKRHNVSIQQQMQSQLTDLREKLTGAFAEITSLVKQKASTDQELLGELASLQQQLATKTSELESLKRSYSATHQQLQTSLLQLQSQMQATSSDIYAAKQQAQAVQDGSQQRINEVEQTLHRLRGLLSTTGKEGQSHAMIIQEDISKLHEALTSLSADSLDHKRQTNQVQSKLTSQIQFLQDKNRRERSPTRSSR